VSDHFLHVEPDTPASESEIREALAPRVAAKILARAPTLGAAEAEQLAHEILAMATGVILAALGTKGMTR
jgi:hypothetical protein